MILDYVLKYDNHSRVGTEGNWEGPVFIQRERESPLWLLIHSTCELLFWKLKWQSLEVFIFHFFMVWTLCGTRFSLCSAFSTAWWECCSLFLTRTWLEKAPYRKQTCRKWSIHSCECPHSWNNITYTKVKFTHSTISGHQLRKFCRKSPNRRTISCRTWCKESRPQATL